MSALKSSWMLARYIPGYEQVEETRAELADLRARALPAEIVDAVRVYQEAFPALGSDCMNVDNVFILEKVKGRANAAHQKPTRKVKKMTRPSVVHVTATKLWKWRNGRMEMKE